MDDIRNRDVAFTTDMWTSIAQDSYTTVTGHYIHGTKCLATRKVDICILAKILFNMLTMITGEHGVEMCGTVTDNAKNMVAAAEVGHFQRVPCPGCHALRTLYSSV